MATARNTLRTHNFRTLVLHAVFRLNRLIHATLSEMDEIDALGKDPQLAAFTMADSASGARAPSFAVVACANAVLLVRVFALALLHAFPPVQWLSLFEASAHELAAPLPVAPDAPGAGGACVLQQPLGRAYTAITACGGGWCNDQMRGFRSWALIQPLRWR